MTKYFSYKVQEFTVDEFVYYLNNYEAYSDNGHNDNWGNQLEKLGVNWKLVDGKQIKARLTLSDGSIAMASYNKKLGILTLTHPKGSADKRASEYDLHYYEDGIPFHNLVDDSGYSEWMAIIHDIDTTSNHTDENEEKP